MPIEDFTTQQVAEALKALEAEAKTLAKKKEGLNARLTKLSGQKRSIESREKEIGYGIERLQAAGLLLREIPGGVRELRGKLAEARENAIRDDITVRQAGEFRGQVVQFEKELIAACQHPLVVQQPGYTDSYSADRDGSYPGERACAICDLHEYEYARWGGTGGYSALVEADHRLFARTSKDDLSGQRTAFKRTKDLQAIVAAFTDKRVIALLQKLAPRPTE